MKTLLDTAGTTIDTLDSICESASIPKSPIDSKRYKIGEKIGQGCWGAVYSARDTLLEEDVAIKVSNPNETAKKQMIQRNLNELKAMKREGINLSACSNVVPRIFETDSNGTPFIIMPRYEKFLDEVIGDRKNHERIFLNYGLTLNQIVDYSSSLANGLKELHCDLKRVHGDIKPDNIAVDKNKLLLNDLGTSTCASTGRSVSPRDNMGFLYTRAPECFGEGSHPTMASDVFAYGSLLYRMITGNYILQNESDFTHDPKKYMYELDDNKFDSFVRKKIDGKVPKQFAKFLKTCLKCDPEKRYYNGKELKQELDKVIESLNTGKKFKKYLKYVSAISVPVVALAGLTYLASLHEPTQITMPKVSNTIVVGSLNSQDSNVIFDRENNLNLHYENVSNDRRDMEIKNITNNRYVAFLSKAYLNAIDKNGLLKTPLVTDAQFEMYLQLTTPDERNFGSLRAPFSPAIKSIEYAMTKAKKTDGKIDIEDMCTVARLGENTWNLARQASKSFDFKDYIVAKDNSGKYIIAEKEQDFLKSWLGAIN